MQEIECTLARAKELAYLATKNRLLVVWWFLHARVSDVVITAPFTECCPQHHLRQSEQIAAPQSAHCATARLLHGEPMSESLRTCSIWQYGLISCNWMSNARVQIPLPPVASHRGHDQESYCVRRIARRHAGESPVRASAPAVSSVTSHLQISWARILISRLINRA